MAGIILRGFAPGMAARQFVLDASVDLDVVCQARVAQVRVVLARAHESRPGQRAPVVLFEFATRGCPPEKGARLALGPRVRVGVQRVHGRVHVVQLPVWVEQVVLPAHVCGHGWK